MIKPTTAKLRLNIIDALRGFALLGILIMNIQAFSMPEQAYLNPFVFGMDKGLFSSADGWVYIVSHLGADQKFMTIFSILFGTSMLLMLEAKEKEATRYLLRRNFFLLLIGMAHAYLLWAGDILVTYALCAFLVMWLRYLSVSKLLVTGALLLSVPIALSLVMTALLPYWSAQDMVEVNTIWSPSADELVGQIASLRGNWIEQMHYRIPSALGLQTVVFVSETAWRVSGLMLWGMALYKLKVFHNVISPEEYRNLALLMLPVGLAVVAFGIHANVEHNWQATYSLFTGANYNYIGSVLVAMAYIGLFIWVYNCIPSAIVMSMLQSVGRMALSNYLLQTLICTFIFYGHGLGLFASVSRVEQLLLLPLIWSLQVAISVFWLGYFSYGPVEWCWRSAVEGRCLAIKRQSRSS